MELLQSDLWTTGPSWLSQSGDNWLAVPASIETTEGKCAKRVHIVTPVRDWNFLFRFQHWRKVCRVTACCLRLRRQVQGEGRSFIKDILSSDELQLASEMISQCLQRTHYADEYLCLENHCEIPAKSNLKSLSPFLDDKGVIRVEGRLGNAVLAWEAKRPIILPNHYVSTLIIRQCCVETLQWRIMANLVHCEAKILDPLLPKRCKNGDQGVHALCEMERSHPRR